MVLEIVSNLALLVRLFNSSLRSSQPLTSPSSRPINGRPEAGESWGAMQLA